MKDQFEQLKTALADRYRVERLVGEGGMALVYAATDLRHDRQVALKTLKPELAASVGADRFLKEIRLTAKLNHPHVLALYDSGEADGILYYVMPFIDGMSLAHRLEQEKQLPIDEAVQITREVAEALGHAHGRGLVHRDIKPENILLSEGHAIVADFGISRALNAAGGERLTQTGMAVGTPAYMSPEQAAGDPDVDGRSDVYSLGCVLYEMLVGQIPFPAPTLQGMMARHTMEQPPSPSVMRAATPPEIAQIVLRAMAKNPVDRFKDGAEFGRAIATASAGPAATSEQGAATVVVSSAPRQVASTGTRVVAVAVAALALTAGWWFTQGGSGSSDTAAVVPTLAVLPVLNVGEDPNDDYFAVGFESELRDALSVIPGLSVTGRSSTRTFRGSAEDPAAIGRQLGVTVTLAADIGKSGDGVVINARLVNVADGEELWSRRFEGGVAEVHDVHEEIARSIVAELIDSPDDTRDVLSIDAPTDHPMAHDKYLWGEFNLDRLTSEGASDAVDNFTMSIGFDSTFAGAYAGLADAQLAVLGFSDHGSHHDLLEAAAGAASTALRLDPEMARARASLGLVHQRRYDWAAAETEYIRALEVGPDDPLIHQRYAELLASVGRLESALTHAERAVDRNRLSVGAFQTLLRVHRANGNTGDAIRAGQRILTLNASDPDPWIDLAILFLADNRPEDAANALESYAELNRLDTEPFRAFAEAASENQTSDAGGSPNNPMANMFEDRPVLAAVLYQLVGRTDDALSVLERALGDRHPDLGDLNMRPALAPLYETPRFRAIATDVGLTPPQSR